MFKEGKHNPDPTTYYWEEGATSSLYSFNPIVY